MWVFETDMLQQIFPTKYCVDAAAVYTYTHFAAINKVAVNR